VEICLVSRGSRARGLPRLAMRAQQWRGYHGRPGRRAAAAATMRSRIGRRLHLAAKRAHQRRGPCRPTQRGTCSLNPRRRRLRGDGLATAPWSPGHSAYGTLIEKITWPPILGLFTSVVVTLTYLRKSRVQAEIGASYGVSQFTVSWAITANAVAGHSAGAVCAGGRGPQLPAHYIIDGTLLPCWS
jgi:hypothetical protein